MTHNMALCAIPLPRCHGACYPDLAFVQRPVARAARPAPAGRHPSRQRRRSAYPSPVGTGEVAQPGEGARAKLGRGVFCPKAPAHPLRFRPFHPQGLALKIFSTIQMQSHKIK